MSYDLCIIYFFRTMYVLFFWLHVCIIMLLLENHANNSQNSQKVIWIESDERNKKLFATKWSKFSVWNKNAYLNWESNGHCTISSQSLNSKSTHMGITISVLLDYMSQNSYYWVDTLLTNLRYLDYKTICRYGY
jgi:hypothetical protein